MAELKRDFRGFKMNKDLDERLVPNGQYRDALNIEISSSEESESGTVQNISSNARINSIRKSDTAVTVGVFTDEENDHIYNFVHKASDLSFNRDNQLLGVRSDLIERISTGTTPSEARSRVVLHDVFDVRVVPEIQSSRTKINIADPKKYYRLSIPGAFNLAQTQIRVGMRVQAINTDGTELWGKEYDIRVLEIIEDESSTGFTYRITRLPNELSMVDAQQINNGVVLRFSSDRILNFSAGLNVEEESNTIAKQKTPTPQGCLISSINKIDDFLLWTDGRNEPKKINIKTCMLGNVQSDDNSSSLIEDHIHTLLVVNSKSNVSSDGTALDSSNSYNYSVRGYMEEEDVTVIKSPPLQQLSVNIGETELAANNYNLDMEATVDSGDTYGPFDFWASSSTDTWFVGVGSNIYIRPVDIEANSLNWNINDRITLTNSGGNIFKLRITKVYTGSGGAFRATVVEEDDNYKAAGYSSSSLETWTANLIPSDTLHAEKFVRFAYRYKYSDGETSAISPWSLPAFIPSSYSYDSEYGYNLGMLNIIEEIEIKDLDCLVIPKGVVEVEFLTNNTADTNVYSIQTMPTYGFFTTAEQYGTSRYQNQSSFVKLPDNNIILKKNMFGAAMPERQLLRVYDAVPTKAVSQEVQANRLMYGNYTEGHDLKDSNNSTIRFRNYASVASNEFIFSSSYESDNTMKVASSSSKAITFNALSSNPIPGVLVIDNVLAYATRGLPLDANVSGATANWTSPASDVDVFTAPVAGNYTFKAYALGYYATRISVDDAVTNSQERLFKPVQLRIAKCDANGYPSTTSLVDQNMPKSPFVTPPTTYETYYYDESGGSYGQGYIVREIDFEGDYSDMVLQIPETTVNLAQGEKVCLTAFMVDNYLNFTSDYDKFTFSEGALQVVSGPSLSGTISVNKGTSSIKSDRSYSLGVAYVDAYGRQSSVLTCDTSDFDVLKSSSQAKNTLVASISSNAPSWAETYKLYIKEYSKKYHNLVLDSAILANDGGGNDSLTAWLVFNSADVDKVQRGQYISLKKKQGTNDAVGSVDARWKILDIQNNSTTPQEVEGGFNIEIGGDLLTQSVITEASDIVGKFFVKVNYDSHFITNIGNLTTTPITPDSINGAVFETEPADNAILDIYYEIGKSYPIRLSNKLAKTYIEKGSKVIISNQANRPIAIVKNVIGTYSKAKNLGFNETRKEEYCKVEVDWIESYPEITEFTKAKFQNDDGSYVEAYLATSQPDDDTIYLHPLVHRTPDWEAQLNTKFRSSANLEISPSWFNCFAFGNGVESDTVKDDFNGNELWTYSDLGNKISGFKANLASDDYKEVQKKSDIIYSELFNPATKFNGLNEFLADQTNTKTLNPDYGSIQKLFSRDNDLVAICEDKCLRIYSQKDALFNADGSSSVTVSDKVLGFADPFRGDYGISKNPESFASDEYRAYFTDKKRGVVIRLSMDGITVISDAGMKTWFRDNIENSNVLIGSFDGRKEDYNLTIHNTTDLARTKDVYTLSFNETTNGWTSFKSYMQESGCTLNNRYYTFKKGRAFDHNPKGIETRNKFYGVQYESSITPIFNEIPSEVKSFKSMNYEGSQSKVDSSEYNNEKVVEGGQVVYYGQDYVDYNNYSNITSKKGWSVESIKTDLQDGKVSEFVKKEGKWFNNIQGIKTEFTNKADGPGNSNLDLSEFTVQGLGLLESNYTLISGSAPSFGYKVEVINANASIGEESTTFYSEAWYSDFLTIYNVKALSGTASFLIKPNSGYSISASNFSLSEAIPSSYLYDSVSFTQEQENVRALITWSAGVTITEDTIVEIPIKENLPSLSATQVNINIENPTGLNQRVGYYDIEYDSNQGSGASTTWTESGSWTIQSLVSQNSNAYLFTIVIAETEGVKYYSDDNLFGLSLNSSEDDQGSYSIYADHFRDGYNNIYRVLLHVYYNREPSQAVASGTQFNVTDGEIIEYYANSDFGTANLIIPESGDALDDLQAQFNTNIPSGFPLNLSFSQTWLFQNPNIANTNYIVYFRAQDLPGGSTDRVASLIIKDPVYLNTLATVSVKQDAAPAATLTFGNESLDGFTSSRVVSQPHEGSPIYHLRLVTDTGDYGSAVQGSNLAVSYSAGSNWIVPTSTYLLASTGSATPNLYKGTFTILDNTSTSDRTATITFTHPDDNSVTSSVTITQDGAYLSTRDRAEISVNSATATSDQAITLADDDATTVDINVYVINQITLSDYKLNPKPSLNKNIIIRTNPYYDFHGDIGHTSFIQGFEDEDYIFKIPLSNTLLGLQGYEAELDLLANTNPNVRSFKVLYFHPRNPKSYEAANYSSEFGYDAIATIIQPSYIYIFAWFNSMVGSAYPTLTQIENSNNEAVQHWDNDAEGGKEFSIATSGTSPSITFTGTSTTVTPGTVYDGFKINTLSSVNGSLYQKFTSEGIWQTNNTPVARSKSLTFTHSNGVDTDVLVFNQDREDYESVRSVRNVKFVDPNTGAIDESIFLDSAAGTQTFYLRVGDYTETDFTSEASPYPVTDKRPEVDIHMYDTATGEVDYELERVWMDKDQSLNIVKNPNWNTSSGVGSDFFSGVTPGGNGVSYSNNILTIAGTDASAGYAAYLSANAVATGSLTQVLEYTIDSISNVDKLFLYTSDSFGNQMLDKSDYSDLVDGAIVKELPKTVGSHKVNVIVRSDSSTPLLTIGIKKSSSGNHNVVLSSVSFKQSTWTHSFSLAHGLSQLSYQSACVLDAFHRWNNTKDKNDRVIVHKRQRLSADWDSSVVNMLGITYEDNQLGIDQGDDSVETIGPSEATVKLNYSSTSAPIIRFLNPSNENEILSTDFPTYVNGFYNAYGDSFVFNTTNKENYQVDTFIRTDQVNDSTSIDFKINHDPEITVPAVTKVGIWKSYPGTNLADLTRGGDGASILVNPNSNNDPDSDQDPNCVFTDITPTSFTWNNPSTLNATWGYKMIKIEGLTASKRYRVSFNVSNYQDTDGNETLADWVNGGQADGSAGLTLSGIDYVNGITNPSYSQKINYTAAVGNGEYVYIVSPQYNKIFLLCRDMATFTLSNLSINVVNNSNSSEDALAKGADITSTPPSDIFTLTQNAPNQSSSRFKVNWAAGPYTGSPIFWVPSSDVIVNWSPNELTFYNGPAMFRAHATADNLENLVVKAKVNGSWVDIDSSNDMIQDLEYDYSNANYVKLTFSLHQNYIDSATQVSSRSIEVATFDSQTDVNFGSKIKINQQGYSPARDQVPAFTL